LKRLTAIEAELFPAWLKIFSIREKNRKDALKILTMGEKMTLFNLPRYARIAKKRKKKKKKKIRTGTSLVPPPNAHAYLALSCDKNLGASTDTISCQWLFCYLRLTLRPSV
jgi:hypothetical protein